MLRHLAAILNFDVTRHGERIGAVDDVIFDQVVWTARHVVAAVGRWPRKRRAIIPRQAATIGTTGIDVDLTDGELAHSVRATEARLVGRDYVAALTPETATASAVMGEDAETVPERDAEVLVDPDLRSAETVIGFKVWGDDGHIGYVKDFVIDDETWIIHCLVISARRRLPSRKVLLPVPWVKRVEREERKLVCRLPQRAVAEAPAFEDGMPLAPETVEAFWERYRSTEEK
jgi:sporulation protein YlmC with PRC-barrel domain